MTGDFESVDFVYTLRRHLKVPPIYALFSLSFQDL